MNMLNRSPGGRGSRGRPDERVQVESHEGSTDWLPSPATSGRFEPPVSALGPLFVHRFERIHDCRIEFSVDISSRPTRRVLGGYYRSRGLVRVYAHDSVDRPPSHR